MVLILFSAHIDNNGKYIFILGEGPTQGLKDTTLSAEKSIWSILQIWENILQNLHCNGANLFANGAEIIKFKAKDSEIKSTSLCLRNISKDFSVNLFNNMKRLG